jgi:filamentous hemagglutinin
LRGSSFNAGIGLTIGLMPGAGSSLDLSLGGGRERADSSLINQQTSIIADERFEAYVEGHTQLDGGLIASLNGDLSLDTGTFGFTDIDERARSDMRRATVSLGLGGGSSPSLGVEGELAHTATDAVTRATIGEGEITIRDEDAQRAREEAGETREVAALNRDLGMARETLRDERAGVRFYASDSSVRAAIEAVDFIGRTLSEISQEAFRNMNSDGFDELADALDRDALTDEQIIAQLGACPTQHGFNLLHWLISPAHASVTCQVETNDGRVIHLTRDEADQCLEIYLAIGERKPSEVQRWVEGLTIVNAFAEPLGNLHAMQSGPVLLGETEDGETFTAMDAQGRYLYRNAVTGIYFYANPRDARDTVTIGTATELAGIFTGVSAASRVIARGAGAVRGAINNSPETPYQIRVDLQFPGRPDPAYSVDTSAFTSGTSTVSGGVRNSRQFWTEWSRLSENGLSQSNQMRIQNRQSPIVDDAWISMFPEHAAYRGQTIVHHHVDYGRYAIPLPRQIHNQSPGFSYWHPSR